MQRTAISLVTCMLLGLVMTGCPDKKVEKEETAAPKAAEHTDDKAAEEEHGEDPEEHAEDEKQAPKKRPAPKKAQAGEEKDQGGW